jgi:DNA-binding NtrC family response regulator
MTSTHPRVLCYGHDELLLYTRQRILDSEFQVEGCRDLAGLMEVLSRGPLDLVLLCQSVPDEECEEAIQRVRAESPKVKVLVLHESLPGACSAHSDATMENLEGPPALLHEIYLLLGIAAARNGAKTQLSNGSQTSPARG